MRARLATLIVAAGVSLGGCAYGNGYGGLSVGSGYGGVYGSPYGYGHGAYGSPYAYGAGYGYNPYYGGYNPYYRSPFYGSRYYGSPYLGWSDGYYYPGSGYYVYDRDRVRRRITEQERQRWLSGIAELAARQARDGQTTDGSSATTQMAPRTARTTRDTSTRRISDVVRSRSTERSTQRTSVRPSTRSDSATSTIRRRLSSSDD